MKKDNAAPEGPADVGEPADEGGKVRPDEDPRRRNMKGGFPGEANEPKPVGTKKDELKKEG